jgi:DNA-binding NtrC family response regulator
MERARLLARSEVILPEHLPRSVRDPSQINLAQPAAAASEEEGVETLEEAEVRLIRQALVANDGNRTHAARALGISRRGLINKIDRYQL